MRLIHVPVHKEEHCLILSFSPNRFAMDAEAVIAARLTYGKSVTRRQSSVKVELASNDWRDVSRG
jgi:hypothetical protein